MTAKMATTIKIYDGTKHELDLLREHRGESYDDVIRKVVFIVKNIEKKPELSRETIKAIDKARERIKRGEFYTAAEVKKRLGL